jgi:hypothetical protein
VGEDQWQDRAPVSHWPARWAPGADFEDADAGEAEPTHFLMLGEAEQRQAPSPHTAPTGAGATRTRRHSSTATNAPELRLPVVRWCRRCALHAGSNRWQSSRCRRAVIRSHGDPLKRPKIPVRRRLHPPNLALKPALQCRFLPLICGRANSLTNRGCQNCSPHQIMTITGHQSLKEVETYTKAVYVKRLA